MEIPHVFPFFETFKGRSPPSPPHDAAPGIYMYFYINNNYASWTIFQMVFIPKRESELKIQHIDLSEWMLFLWVYRLSSNDKMDTIWDWVLFDHPLNTKWFGAVTPWIV